MCVSLVAALQFFYYAPTVQYKSCAALKLTRDAWKYFKMARFLFVYRLQPFHLKYPDLLLDVCPDGWRAWAGETKQIIGCSGSGWKGLGR